MFNSKRREISSEGIDTCFYTVDNYRKQFSDEFHRYFLANSGTSVSFTTDKDRDVKFISLGYNLFWPLCKIIVTDSKSGIILLECKNGEGTVSDGQYGLDYHVCLYRDACLVRPFRIVLGKKVYLFADKAIDEMETLIKELAEDIKTIRPHKETETHLKGQHDSIKEVGEEPTIKEESISSKRSNLENLRTELISLTETFDLESDEQIKGRSF